MSRKLLATILAMALLGQSQGASLVNTHGGVYYPSPHIMDGHFNNGLAILAGAATGTIDATGEKFGMVFRVPKTGTISKVGFLTGNVATSQTLKVGLYTVATDGTPNTAAYGSMVAGTQTSPSTSTAYTVTLGTPATATQGDVVAAVVEFNVSVGNLVITALTSNGAPLSTSSYTLLRAGGGPTWSKNTSSPVLWLEYNDGTYYYVPYCYPATTLTNYTITNATSPDEVGVKFQVPFACRLSGLVAPLRITSSADFTVKVYDGSNNVQTSVAVLAAQTLGSSLNFVTAQILLPTSVSLAANTTYRMTILATTANNTTQLFTITAPSAAAMDAFANQTWVSTNRSAGGAWTDGTTEMPLMMLLLDQLPAGASGPKSTFVFD